MAFRTSTPIGGGGQRARTEITCRMALYSPNTAVVHSHDYMLSLQGDAENAGAVLSLNSTVVGVRESSHG